jgi:EmrB/QacA subfamily drug resistance transporter
MVVPWWSCLVVDDNGRLHPHHPHSPDAVPASGRTRAVALATLCLCALTAGVDMTITNVALPFIGRSLDAPIDELQWTVDAYNIVLAGLLVLGGALADRYGRRRIFLISYALFGIASVCAALSPTAEALIGSRALMGVGAAGVTAPALAIVASMYPPNERGRAIGAFVVFGASGLAIGPIAGGFLLDHFWWGSVFLVNVPVVVAGVLVGARTIPESRAAVPVGGRPPLDVPGALLSFIGLAALLFGVIEGPARGWSAPAVLVGLVGGVVLLAAFVRRELRVPAPLFDVRILARPAVAIGSATLFVAYVLFNSFLFLTPQYFQDSRSESIVAVGLLLVPFAIVFGASSLRAQTLLQRLGARVTIPAGLALTAISAAFVATTLGGSLWSTVAGTVALALGLSLLIAPPSTVVMNALPPAKAGDGSSMNFVSRFVGASIGIAIVGSILATVYANDIDASLASLSSAQADKAQGSVQGALEVADTLGSTSGDTLASAARDAFDRGASAAYVTVAVLAAFAAVVAWFVLGRSVAAPTGGDTLASGDGPTAEPSTADTTPGTTARTRSP